MRRTDGDKHAGVANLQPAEPVDHGKAVDREPLMYLNAYLPHFRERHRFIGLVLKMHRRPAVGLITDEAVEAYDGSVLIRADVLPQRLDINRPVYQFKAIVGRRVYHRAAQPPLTGGRKAISSPAATRVSQAANS